MMWLYGLSVAAVGLVLVAALIDRRMAIALASVILLALWTQFQGVAGTPADADNRLVAEEYRILAISQVSKDGFLLSVRYGGGDIRTYVLDLPDQEDRDKFLKAQQSMKRGVTLKGRAKHPRTGLQDDGGMDFGFDAEELAVK